VKVGSQSIQTDKVIIATGTRRERQEWLNYTEDLPTLTSTFEKIVILGGDVGGVELAWLMRNLGKEVYLIEKQDSLLYYLDKDLREAVTNYFRKIGVKLFLNTEVSKISKNLVVTQKGDEISGDVIFLTYGRKTNIEGFEKLSKDGKYIAVDEYLRTSVRNVYAAGDIIGTHTAHEAIYAGVIAGINASGGNEVFNAEGIPKVVYTHPQIAYVGKSEGKCVKVQVASLTRSLVDKDTEGFFKLCTQGEEIKGAFAFMPYAEEAVTLVSLLMRAKVKLRQAIHMIPPHPSYMEAVYEALLRILLTQ